VIGAVLKEARFGAAQKRSVLTVPAGGEIRNPDEWLAFTSFWSDRLRNSVLEVDLLNAGERQGKVKRVFAGGIVMIGDAEEANFHRLIGERQQAAFLRLSVGESQLQVVTLKLRADDVIESRDVAAS
jgi:hypothetical protein